MEERLFDGLKDLFFFPVRVLLLNSGLFERIGGMIQCQRTRSFCSGVILQ